jgi:S1-C subfamily serine protease
MLACLAVLLTATTPDAPAGWEDYCQSVAWVRVGSDGQGTGWLVDGPRRLLLTALHVVGQADRLTATFPLRRDGQLAVDRAEVLAQTQALRQAGRLVDGEVIARHPELDLAVVRLDAVPRDTVPVRLRASRARPGEPVWLIGQRGDLDALWSHTRGWVRSAGPLTAGYGFAGQQLAQAAPMLYLQLPINVGDSGGPVFDAQGRVLGMVVAFEKKAPPTALAISAQALASTLQLPADNAHGKQPAAALGKQLAAAQPAVGVSVYSEAVRALATVQTLSSTRRATAWIVDHPQQLLLTSARAVAGSERVWVTFPHWAGDDHLQADRSYYQQQRVVLARQGLVVEGLVLARDPSRDVALIEVASLPAHAQALTLAKQPARVGQSLHLLGNPAVLDVLWNYAAGSVRQSLRARLDPAPNPAAPSVPALALQAPALAGDSGGPVLNDGGEVVAVQSGRDEAQQQLVYALPAAEVVAFLSEHRHRSTPTNAQQWLARCDHFLAHASPEWALRVCEAAVRAEPKAATLRLRRASALLALGQLDAAYADLDSAQASGPTAAGWALLAEWYHAKGRANDAVRAADAALKLSARSAAAYTARARARWALGQAVAARADLDEALWHDANYSPAYLLRAELAKTPAEREQARLDCTRAIELRPAQPAGYRVRAELTWASQDRRAALADWATLADLSLGDAEVRTRLARSALALGDVVTADQPGREAILLEPKRARELLPALSDCPVGGEPAEWLRVGRGWLQALGASQSPQAERARRLLGQVDACRPDVAKQVQTLRAGLQGRWDD